MSPTALAWLLMREIWRRTDREIELAVERQNLLAARERIEADRSRLAGVNAALLASSEQAQAASRAKSQFLANISHELRTPLHAIIGFSEIVRDHAPKRPGDPPIAEYASDILSSGRHLLDLINKILDIAKVESGTVDLVETAVAPAALVRASLISIRPQAQARQQTVDARVPEDLPAIRCDVTRLRQVLINLLSNAVKFTPAGGQISVAGYLDADGSPVFRVSDTGIGMSSDELVVALEPFGQVDGSLSRQIDGTGLGLTLARGLVELHGGELRFSSVKGQGTSVEVRLPASRAVIPA
jgi:two-component system cell cycle sensor histidine kinase PleC